MPRTRITIVLHEGKPFVGMNKSMDFLDKKKVWDFWASWSAWIYPELHQLRTRVIYRVFWTKVPILKTNPQLSYKFPHLLLAFQLGLRPTFTIAGIYQPPKKLKLDFGRVGSPRPVNHVKRSSLSACASALGMLGRWWGTRLDICALQGSSGIFAGKLMGIFTTIVLLSSVFFFAVLFGGDGRISIQPFQQQKQYPCLFRCYRTQL